MRLMDSIVPECVRPALPVMTLLALFFVSLSFSIPDSPHSSNTIRLAIFFLGFIEFDTIIFVESKANALPLQLPSLDALVTMGKPSRDAPCYWGREYKELKLIRIVVS